MLRRNRFCLFYLPDKISSMYWKRRNNIKIIGTIHLSVKPKPNEKNNPKLRVVRYKRELGHSGPCC